MILKLSPTPHQQCIAAWCTTWPFQKTQRRVHSATGLADALLFAFPFAFGFGGSLAPAALDYEMEQMETIGGSSTNDER